MVAAGEHVWETIISEAAEESSVWSAALRPTDDRELVAVFSPLGARAHTLGIETIYEGYLLHYGRPRLFAPDTPATALLLGDYLYAHGLVRIANVGEVGLVADLAELISLSAQIRADGGGADAWAWAGTVAVLGTRELADARAALRERGDAAPLAALARAAAGEAAVERALSAHRARVR